MKKIKIVLIMLICMSFTGCWDKVEIDRRVFVSTIGIDVGKDIQREQELKNFKEDQLFSQRDLDKLKITYSFPDISDFAPNKAVIKGDNMFTVDTYSMEGALGEISSRSSRNVYMEHARLIMLSNDILTYPYTMTEIFDYLERQPKINRKAYVVMTEGKPEDFIKFKPQIDSHIQSYISGLMENSNRNGYVLPVTLNELLMLLTKNGNAIIPSIKIDKEKNELILTGTSIIKNYEFKGKLDPIGTLNLEILRGKLKSGIKVVYDEGHPIDFEIDGVNRKIKAHKDGEGSNLVIDIDINLEGTIKSAYFGKKDFDKEKLKELEDSFDKSIEYECSKVVEYLQKEAKVDAIGINDHIEKFNPSIWKEVKDNWEESFSGAQINIKVNTFIRRVGITK
ncbi:Ger(x)C family spore germination protein [Clostridium amazonitimonense]|uniref:Ger(x)C family spore germination protein n=1 Tax=Clostridium amazonitimonense TaxID=1499689 RepID=UPI000509A841|nr:Ger(x)C family spore germination protein [Clostridium amazonitimonense]